LEIPVRVGFAISSVKDPFIVEHQALTGDQGEPQLKFRLM